jgi:signal transduction histidine kinase
VSRHTDLTSVRASVPDEARQRAGKEAPARRRGRQGEPLRVIHDLSAALIAASNPEDIYNEALAGLARALGADRAAVLLYGQDDVMRFVAWRGLSEGYRSAVEGHSPWARDERAPEPIFIRDVEEDDGLAAFREVIGAEGIRALGFLPLVYRGRLLGKLMIYCDAPRRFTDEDAQVAKIIANQVVFAVMQRRDTNHERAERQLVLLSEASRRLMEAQLDARAVLDTVGRLVTERLARACLLVVHEDRETERPSLTVGHDRDGAAADQLRAELARDGAVARVVARGEAVISAEVLAVPLRRHGQVIGVCACRGPLGAAFEESDQLLLQELADRAALALDNAQLYRRSEGAVKLRDDFLSVAGHELRTPLTALKLQITALERVGGDPVSLQRLQAARRQVARLAALTDELLDVARITTGRLTLELEPVDVTTVTLEVAGRLAEALTSSGSALTIEAPTPVVGRWDKMHLDQVMTNLLTNAIKYGCGRPIQIVVEARGAMARLTVRDQGIGIESDMQGKIFERFERAVSPRSYGGLGLGLWIVSQIVSALGGSIRVDSVPAQGAAFTVDLPLAPPDGAALAAQ